MASSTASPSSFSSSSPFPSPSLPLPRSPLFTPIPEHDREEEDDEEEQEASSSQTQNQQEPNSSTTPYKHHPTPLHTTKKKKKPQQTDSDSHVVNCNNCRPSSREKISIVPLDTNGRPSSSSSSSIPNPNINLFKSLFSTITGKCPRPSSASTSSQPLDQERTNGSHDDDHWKLTAAELSRKLLHATRKREEAELESSRLKHSMSELEKKLTKLESYCALDRCATATNAGAAAVIPVEPPFPLDAFLRAVSEARTMVRHLSRSLAGQIRQFRPPKTLERISLVLQPYDVRIPAAGGSGSPTHRSLLFYLEALLNRVFYENFETTGFKQGGSDRILDPFARCKSNRASYDKLKALSWDEVLSRGTRHYSKELSGFCDRKMSEVVKMLGWTRAWPEPLLQAFFCAAKGVWLVHLIAWSAHPAVPLFRVEQGARFDPVYMEDVEADRVRPALAGSVRMMVAPGFYVHSSVIKCKVLCVYDNKSNSSNISGTVSGGSSSSGNENSCGHMVQGEIPPLAI